MHTTHLFVGAAVEQSLVRGEPFFGAVAVVYVEIDHSDFADAVRVLRVPVARRWASMSVGIVLSKVKRRARLGGATADRPIVHLAPIAALLKKQKPHARSRSA